MARTRTLALLKQCHYRNVWMAECVFFYKNVCNFYNTITLRTDYISNPLLTVIRNVMYCIQLMHACLFYWTGLVLLNIFIQTGNFSFKTNIIN